MAEPPRQSKKTSFISDKASLGIPSRKELGTIIPNFHSVPTMKDEIEERNFSRTPSSVSNPNGMQEEKYSPSRIDIDPCDIEDNDNVQCVTQYVKDIFRFLKENEDKFTAKFGGMIKVQNEVNEKMRAILIDWLVDVHGKFKLLSETLFLAVNIIDRFIEKVLIPRARLQLVGITALFIAAKYEEIYPPELKDFVYVTDKAYTKADLLEMEGKIIAALQFNFVTTSPNRFLERYARVAKLDQKFYFFARYLLEICLLDYRMLRYVPSQIGCAVVFLANKLSGANERNEGVLRNSGYPDTVIKPIVHEMILLLQTNEKSTLQAIRRKYSTPKNFEVSKIRINVVEKKM